MQRTLRLKGMINHNMIEGPSTSWRAPFAVDVGAVDGAPPYGTGSGDSREGDAEARCRFQRGCVAVSAGSAASAARTVAALCAAPPLPTPIVCAS